MITCVKHCKIKLCQLKAKKKSIAHRKGLIQTKYTVELHNLFILGSKLIPTAVLFKTKWNPDMNLGLIYISGLAHFGCQSLFYQRSNYKELKIHFTLRSQ